MKILHFPKLLEVNDGNAYIGKVAERPTFCSGKQLEIWDKNDEMLFNITGPCCPFGCGSDVQFFVRQIYALTSLSNH